MRALIPRSRVIAASLGHLRVEPGHVLLALLDDRDLVDGVLQSLDVSAERIRSNTLRLLGTTDPSVSADPDFSDEAASVFYHASSELLGLDPKKQAAKWAHAMRTRSKPVDDEICDAEHVLLGLIVSDEDSAHMLSELGLGYERVREAVRLATPGVS